MLIWFAMVIPVVISGGLYFVFKKKVLWWEMFIPFVASFILIAICKYSTESVQVHDKEYWGSYVVRAEYYEPWDEEVSCRHPKYETRTTTHTDADGHTYTTSEEVFVGYEHAYDVDDHPASWQVVDSLGVGFSIDESYFHQLVRQFGNKTFVDLNRDYHSQDGDEYVTEWEGRDETLEPITTIHSYENRVQASSTVCNYEHVDPKDYKLYDYPKVDGLYCPIILGYHAPERANAEAAYQRINAKYGSAKKIRVWVLVFVDKPRDAGLDQEGYWKGGNKNELVITIGITKSREVRWVHVFGWSKNELLKIQTRNFVRSQKQLDLVSLAQWLEPEIRSLDQPFRRDFREFSYLTVDPPIWMVSLTFLLTFALNIGISFWLVENDYNEDQGHFRQVRWRKYGGYY